MIQIRKGEVRLYQFTDDTILYTENSMEFTHTHTNLLQEASPARLQDTRSTFKNPTVFQTSMVVQWLTNEGDTGLIPALGTFHMPWDN